MQDNTRRNPPERPAEPTPRQHVGWREILTRAYLPQLLTLCLAIWLHAANSMLTATTMPDAVRDIGDLRRRSGDAGRNDRDRAGSLLPSAQQTGFAFGAALAGIIANALGFEHMTRIEEYRTAAFWLFAAFVPPALLGNVIAWRFGNRIGAGSAS